MDFFSEKPTLFCKVTKVVRFCKDIVITVCIVSEIKGLMYDYHSKGLNFFNFFIDNNQ